MVARRFKSNAHGRHYAEFLFSAEFPAGVEKNADGTQDDGGKMDQSTRWEVSGSGKIGARNEHQGQFCYEIQSRNRQTTRRTQKTNETTTPFAAR
mmetsp:Transcript_31063/g.35387  ORF Transcript_31063/g.35387 Transcript_31063/m.35387 type:complete len:95 (+) Transcript_31063:175-459(+)